MLDFPNTPVEGDTHTEKGQTWTYVNGVWIVGDETGRSIEIVESGLPSGQWQVWGDVLIQWGKIDTNDANNVTVAFPQPFKDGTTPEVVVTSRSTNATTATITGDPTPTQFTFARFNNSGGGATANVNYVAIGEAPDDLKQPKSVISGVGDGYEEFHDPTGTASWRIIGSTLECWGRFDTTSSSATNVTFPKSFAVKPVLTLGTNHGATQSRNANARSLNTTAFSAEVRRSNDQTRQVAEVSWHAIGEWDGVS